MKKIKSLTEELLIEAATTIKKLPGARARQKLTSWPNIQSTTANAAKPMRKNTEAPTQQAINRLDVMLDCLMSIKDEERRILWARASNITWRKLVVKEKHSHMTLRKRYNEGLGKLERVLNRGGEN